MDARALFAEVRQQQLQADPRCGKVIGGCSAHGEGWATLRGSVVVRLSVWDRVAVGGGRMYTAVVPRSS